MQHKLVTKHRTVIITLTEMTDRIIVAFEFSKTGRLGDEEEIKKWQLSIFRPYDKDPRPFQVTNPRSGQVATIFGDETSFVAMFEQRKDIH